MKFYEFIIVITVCSNCDWNHNWYHHLLRNRVTLPPISSGRDKTND